MQCPLLNTSLYGIGAIFRECPHHHPGNSGDKISRASYSHPSKQRTLLSSLCRPHLIKSLPMDLSLWPGTDGVFIEAGGQFLLSQPDAQRVEESSVHPYRREGMPSSVNSAPPPHGDIFIIFTETAQSLGAGVRREYTSLPHLTTLR